MANKLSFRKRSDRYAVHILGGKIPACDMVGLACERYQRDIQDQRWVVSDDRIDRICTFSELFPHVKGKWARANRVVDKLVCLEDWQVFLFANMFGFLNKTSGLRRFRQALILVPRKNGKSILGALAGLYMFGPDKEPGAEVFSGATSEKQAWEVFRPAKLMATSRKDFQEHFGIRVGAKNMNIPTTGSRFEPLIGNPGDGSSPHCAVVDEFHEHKDSSQYDTMISGMGAREQPLLLVITTAGDDMSGPCYDELILLRQILKREIDRPDYFGIEYTIDKNDRWDTEKALVKANPNIGVSVFRDYLLTRLEDAKSSARKQGTYKTKHLNVWVGARHAYFDTRKWSEGKANVSQYIEKGQRVFVGLDLASKVDMAALHVVRALPNDRWATFSKYYLPMETVESSGREAQLAWGKQGHITLTDGSMTDFDVIYEDILKIHSEYLVQFVVYDPYQATMMAARLMKKEVPVAEYRQTVLMMSDPMKHLEAIILSNRIYHEGNPAMLWMMGNVVARDDKKQNVYPVKLRPPNLIDGPIALIMAIGSALAWIAEQEIKGEDKGSVYKRRGLRVL